MKTITQGKRLEFHHQPVKERILHFGEFTTPLTEKETAAQTQRCLQCATPYCSNNCPLHNRPVDFNRLVREGRWRDAWNCLNSTNSFPEFTSRVCPAICEAGCTQYWLEDSAVGIKTIERAIIERAWRAGWVVAQVCPEKTGKTVAVVGSGPAGLACAQGLARAGHQVTVFEKSEKPGGLLRFGIPDFKLDKSVIDRRIRQLESEGVQFVLSTAVGCDVFEKGIVNTAQNMIAAKTLREQFDAIVLACGAEIPRDLHVPGRDSEDVEFAVPYLRDQNCVVNGLCKTAQFSMKDQNVVVIGGGDTSSDCVGIARRQGAKNITQIDINQEPPEHEDKLNTWPDWPRKKRLSTSQEEGCDTLWNTLTKEIVLDSNGHVTAVRCVRLEWTVTESGERKMTEIENSSFDIPCQKVLLAMGFASPSQNLLKAFAVSTNSRGNASAPTENGLTPFRASDDKIFVCGDTRSGQSLVVRAMSEGRRCAASVDSYLRNTPSELPAFPMGH